jgi:hypothetical protein
LQECCLGLVCFVCFEAFWGFSGAASPPMVRLKTILELFVQLLGGWWQWVFAPSVSMASTHNGFPVGAPASYPFLSLLLVLLLLCRLVVELCISVKKLMERGIARLEKIWKIVGVTRWTR